MPKSKPKSKRSGSPGRAHARPSAAAPRPSLRERIARWDRALLAILLLATMLRMWGIGDRLPDATLNINVLDDTAIEETDRTTILRSWQMWQGGMKDFDLNPHTGGWPALSFYLTLGIQIGYKAWYGLAHAGATATEFAERVQREPAPLFFIARLVNALIGIASVALTWRLAFALAGRAAAILAALFLAANPLHILTSQHVSDPNLLALVFVACAAIAMVKVAQGGGIVASALAGVSIGLAAACKYVPLVLLAPLAAAHWPGRRWKAYLVSAALVGVAMFAASPFTFLDWKTTLVAFEVQQRSLFSDWVGQSAFPISLPTYLIASLPKALGWPVYLLAVVGFVALWRLGTSGRIATLCAVAVIVANGLLKAAQERYLLVAYPLLMAAAGVGAIAVVRLAAARFAAAKAEPAAGGAVAASTASGASPPKRAALVAAGILAVAGIAAPAPDLFIVRDALRRPDSRHEARRWINNNIGTTRRLAVELYGPVFRPDERNIVIWPFFATQAPLVAPAYQVPFLDGVEMIALSGEISRRFEADSIKYPAEAGYYRWLRTHGQLLWRSDDSGRVLSGPKLEVRAIPTGLSTRAQRDSLWARLVPEPPGTYRLALWCNDMGMLFAKAGDQARAEEWALRGLKVGAKNLRARLGTTLAMARLNRGDYVGAEASTREAIADGASAQELHFYRGIALTNLGRVDEGLQEMRVGFNGNPRMRMDIAQALMALGRYEEAVAELAEVPQGIPERAAARRNMAILLMTQLGRREEGLVALREAAALETDPGQARLLRDELARQEAKTP